ncbi:MAG: hypothetical protein IKL52_02155, partial [Candidatus Gastranaerophilales bacterium]|nr:hypothetical protein [Candidatus Gastranaerophilales bacterium]
MAIRRVQTHFNNINLSQLQISEEVTDEAVNGASIFPLKNTQDIKALDPLLYEEDGYYDEADEADITLCENNELIDINEDQLIIKQLEAQIEKLESEYAANQEGKGVAGTIGGFFSSCWNGIKGDGFKDSDRVELDKKIALLQAAKADLTKLNEAYKAITGEELTDEVKQNAVVSQNIADSLTSEDKQQIVDILKVQADSLAQMMQQAQDDQGWFSSCMGGINNFLGFGTNSIKANAKIEEYIEQINSLDPNDPDFAAKYQALTGEALSLEGLNELAQGFSKVSNSSAAEAIMDYEETQAAAKEIGAGIVTGLAVAACVIAAPVTGGASLALGAAVGGATSVLINGTDTIGTSKTYSLEQGILDFAGGAIDGAVTALTLGGANLAGKGFSVLRGMGGAAAKEGARQVVSGGFTKALKTAFGSFGKAALRSAGIATFSSTANYLLDTVGKDIVYNDLWDNYTKADTPSNIVQNEDGTYSIYYALSDSKTGDLISYEIETFDTLSQDEEGNLVKGNILDVSQTNDFDFGDLAKQTVISAGSAVIGTGIGKFTGNIINPYATSFTNSVALGNAIEIAADMTLSLGADYFITSAQAGEFVDGSEFLSWDRVLNEGRNQIRGLLIGMASSKVNPTDTIAQDAIRSGLDGKTPIEVEGLPVENRGVGSDLFIKLDGEEVPLGQQRVLEDAVKLVTNGDNPQNAVNLLVANGASEAQAQEFIDEVIRLASDETIGLVFDPETGELSQAGAETKMEIQELDHPVAGDNVGVKLDLSSSTQKKPIEFSEEEVASFAENRELSGLYKAYIDRYDTLSEGSRVAIEKVLNHAKNVNQSNLNGRALSLLSAEGETIDCHINMYSTSTLGTNYRSEVIEILDAQGDVVGKINYEFGDNTGHIHIQNMINNTDGAVSHVGSELHNLLQSRCQELGIEEISLDSVDSAVVFHYKNGFRAENPEVNAKIEELIANSDGKRITFDGVKMFLKVPKTTSLDTDFSSVDYKGLSPEQRIQAIGYAIDLASVYKKGIQNVKGLFNEIFGGINTVSTRAKSPKSILEKIIAKQTDDGLVEITLQDASRMIGDGYGVRIQVPSLTQEQTDYIIKECLAGTGKTQAQFQELIDAGEYGKILADDDFRTTFEILKETRSQGVVDSLVRAITSGQIVPANGAKDYFNNYGSEITSYLSNAQLLQIDAAYYEKYHRHLTFVNSTSVEVPNDSWDMSPEAAPKIDLKSGKRAEKDSGYTDA